MAVKILSENADPATMNIEFAASVEKKYDAQRCEALGITIPDGYTAIEAA